MSDEAALVDTLVGALEDKAWRMAHLYQILDEDKAVVQFEPREQQARFYRERHNRNFVPKSRKYGISTAVVLDYLDDCIWAKAKNPVHAAHVDFRDDDAKEKLQIARFAWEHGPEHPEPQIAEIWRGLHANNPLVVDNASELQWANGSKQQASTSFMGGTPNRLHVSEFGPLSAQFPDRANKVKRGTFNAAAKGAIVDIETTMEGGTVGECAEIFKLAMEYDGKPLTALDWRMFFIPWWVHPSYRLDGCVPQKAKTLAYFEEIRNSDGIELSLEQMAWYEKKAAEQKVDMFTQFPTVVRECLQVGGERAFFDSDGLIWMRNQIVSLEPMIEHGDLILQGDVKDVARRSVFWRRGRPEISPFRIFEHPLDGESYLVWADFAVGKQAAGSTGERDTNAFGVMKAGRIDPSNGNVTLPTVVACCQPEDRSITTETIRRIVALSIYYGDCMTVPEINNKDDIALRLMAAGVKTMWVQGRVGADGAMPGAKRTEEVFGWLTQSNAEGGGSRKQILDNMQELTMQQGWICVFPEILDQMCVFIVNKKGKPEAAPGKHDDFVMAPAIGLFTLPAATKYRGKESRMLQRAESEWMMAGLDPRGV